MTIPRRYARCVSNGCPAPDFTPYRCGQRVNVAAFNEDDSDFAAYVGVIACRR